MSDEKKLALVPRVPQVAAQLATKYAEYVKLANKAKSLFAEFNYLVQKDRAEAGITDGFMRDVFGDGAIKPEADCKKPPATV